jgi:hypothetical protein
VRFAVLLFSADAFRTRRTVVLRTGTWIDAECLDVLK